MIALDEIRKKADKFRTRVLWWNGLNYYAASAFAITVLGYAGFANEDLMFRAGCGLIIAALVFGAWYVRKHGSPDAPPSGTALSDHIGYHRAELVRQRDLNRNVLWWSMLPVVPGIGLFIAGIERAGIVEYDAPVQNRVAFIVAAFTIVWLFSLWRAHRQQKQIDALDRMKAT